MKYHKNRDAKFSLFHDPKKGIFNKNPMVYKTDAEVDADTKGDLSDKLKAALKYLPSLGIKGVIQGDLLFTNDLKAEVIAGHKYTTFHPNTIVYAVPYDSPEGKTIRSV